ncbi:MAG: heme-binding protein [Verrucomicrobiae bacterium]
MRKILLLVVILVIGALLAIAGCRTSRSGYKSAPYTVVRSDGDFELRDYPVLKVVETTMKDGGSGGSFNRLFRFITGGNDDGKKIAMTTPVFMAGGESTMAFVMPADLRKVPQPTDGSVTVREMPAGRFAVLRYSGERSLQQEAEHLERLKAWVAAQGLNVSAAPVYAYFDPPWTPPFLRRNEVMLCVDL